jgi:hypothetical protein
MRCFEAIIKANENGETLTDDELLVLIDNLCKTNELALKKSLLLPQLFNEEDLDRQRKSLGLLLDLKNNLIRKRNETKN